MKKLKSLLGVGAAIPLVLGTAVLSADNNDNENSGSGEENDETVENIIYLIGDGLGHSQVSATAYYLGEGPGYGDLTMDTFPYAGQVRTHSNDSVVTDSAAAGTALASGHKTDNDVVGMVPSENDEDYEEVESILVDAQDDNKSTGLVTDTTMTHATPAVFAAHVEDRGMEEEIAPQMLDYNVDVLFGGGIEYFLPESEGGEREDDRNLIEEAEADGYELLYDRDDLLESSSDQRLGLFSEGHMAFELDRETTNEPSLAEMTDTAIENLSQNDDGFFLMVEGGRIDHGGHDNSPASTIENTLAFDDAIEVALDYAQNDPNTLVVVTADHETGGMSVGSDGEYEFNRDVINDVTRSSGYMGDEIDDDLNNVEDVLAEYAGIDDLTAEEIEIIESAEAVDEGISDVISQRAFIGWTTPSHTAADVPVYAYGPSANEFATTLDNTELPEIMLEAMDLDEKITVDSIITLVEAFDEEGEFESNEAVHDLTTHLTAVSHYEDQEEYDKVVNHMGGFKDLLDHQLDNEMISEEAYDTLMEQTDALIEQWQ